MILVGLLSILAVSGCYSKNLPSHFPKCNRNDPNINNCIEKAIETVRPYLVKGVPEIKFYSLTPLTMSEFHVDQNIPIANFSAHVKNFTLNNVDTFKITDIHFDTETPSISGKIEFVKIPASTDFIAIEGSIAHIPLKGSGGRTNIVFDNLKGIFNIIAKPIKKKHIEYFNVQKVDLKLELNDIDLQFDGLFDGNAALGIAANNLLRQNSKLVALAVTPALEKVFSEYVLRYANWLSNKVPSEELFPSS